MPIIKDENIDNYTLIDFIRYIQRKYYPDIDISFMDTFMNMLETEDHIISSDELAKYGILSIKSDRNNLDSGHVKRFLETKKLVETIHFKVQQVQEIYPSGSQPRDVYMLTPYAFKTCLIHSTKQPKYKDYYLILEQCVSYYNKQMIINKNSEIKLLLQKLDKVIETNIELIEEVRSLRKYIDEIREYLRQRAIPPEKDGTINSVVIMKNNVHFSYIRGQDKYVKKQSEVKLSNGYTKIHEFKNVPNGVYLCINIIDYFKMKKMIRCTRNDFVLVTDEINNDELVEIMKEIFEERLMV